MKKKVTISLGECPNISEINQLKAQFLRVSETASNVVIDASEVLRTDTAVIQLLLMFLAYCKEKGLTVTWVGQSDYFMSMTKVLYLSDLLSSDKS